MSIPEFRAFKFDPVNIKGKKFIPVVVETNQSDAPVNTFATSSVEVNKLAQPKFYPTVQFNQWFESVIALTPKPLEINSTRNDGDFRYSSHTNNEKSYDCAFVEEDALNQAKIQGLYQSNNEYITPNIDIQNPEQLTSEEKKFFTSEIKKASEYLSAKKTITITNLSTKSSIFINLFEGETKTIGRMDLKEICDSNYSISKDHIGLQLNGGKIYLKDVSKYGISAKNSRLVRNHFYDLEDNFRIQIGENDLNITVN